MPTTNQLPRHFAVAVDGPSGSGKSSTARGVAQRLDWNYLDTGAMYRAITWWFLSHGVEPDDVDQITARVAGPLTRDFDRPQRSRRPGRRSRRHRGDPRPARHRRGKRSQCGPCRPRANGRRCNEPRSIDGPIVIEGRDIGTVVVPDAPVKVFLIASSRARAHRRAAELSDHDASVEDTLESLKRRDLLDSTREFSPLVMADDAVKIDSTDLTLDASRRHNCRDGRATTARHGGRVTDFNEHATALDDAVVDEIATFGPLPVLAVVGRPNVGKSTLVNRILGRREAVVEDRPGVTRDRVAYDTNWSGRDFVVVDTGGWERDAQGLAARVAAQAELAVAAADAVLLVVDANVGVTDTDEAVVRVLRKAGKPVVLAANKVDDQRTETEATFLVVPRPRSAVSRFGFARSRIRRTARRGLWMLCRPRLPLRRSSGDHTELRCWASRTSASPVC